MKQGGSRHSIECSIHELCEEVVGVLLSDLACSCDREFSLGETFAGLRLVPKAEFFPLDGGPKRPFGNIFGRLHTLMADEDEQVSPILEGSPGPGTYLIVEAVPLLEAVSFHSSLWKSRGVPKLAAADAAITECAPTNEDMPHLVEHAFGEELGLDPRTVSKWLKESRSGRECLFAVGESGREDSGRCYDAALARARNTVLYSC